MENIFPAFKQGIHHLRNGNFEHISRYIRNNMLPTSDLEVQEIESSFSSIGANAPLLCIRGDRDVFRHVTNDGGQIQIESSETFDTVLFELVSEANIMDISFEVEFLFKNDTVHTDTGRYQTGKFDESSLLPQIASCPTEADEIIIKIHDLNLGNNGSGWKELDQNPITLPSISHSSHQDCPPVFIISVDSLRYDRLDFFESVINELGQNVIIPDEPRTQGVSTWPAHASLFTGHHPTTHGCTGNQLGPQIDTSLMTLGELFEAKGYRNSACVSSGNLSPEIGFGRGFHRYELQPIDWEERRMDARTIFQTCVDWVDTDLESGASRVFYFLHLFDNHYPYIPPYPERGDIDVDFRLFDEIIDLARERDYEKILTDDPFSVSENTLSDIRQYYDRCARFSAVQLTEFLRSLRRREILDDSLFIILGDHGEDFYENGFLFHHSLYEENIKPACIIKPPVRDKKWEVDSFDYIDIFPTVAELLGDHDLAQQTAGIPIQSQDRDDDVRIVERLNESYNIKVERPPERVTFSFTSTNRIDDIKQSIKSGPDYIESSYRSERYNTIQSTSDLTENESKHYEIVREFVRNESYSNSGSAGNISDAVSSRLEDLGYK